MEKTLSQLIAEMDRIEALSEQLTQRDKSLITSLYNQYKGSIQPNLQGLAARVYDAAINDKQLSSNDVSQAKQVYNQVMPQIPAPMRSMYGGIINRGLDQLNKSVAPAQSNAPAAPAQGNAPAAPAQGNAPAPSGGAVSGGTLRRGAKGQAVTDLQNKLGIEADGQYGPGTAAAVQKFQQENGLEVDGVAGPATLAALNSAPAAPAQGNEPAAEPAAQAPAAQAPAAPAPQDNTQSSGPDDGSRAGQEPNREPGAQAQAGSNNFDTAQEVGGTVYQNDAEAIKGLMAKSGRTQEEELYLKMLARKYDFYGKPENIGPAIAKAEAAAAAAKPPRQTSSSSGSSSGSSQQGYTPKDFPSMAAAMQKVDYYQPGGKISINGVPHIRDVDGNGRKFFRPLDQQTSTQGTLTSRLDTKGQTPSRESVELNRIKGLAGL